MKPLTLLLIFLGIVGNVQAASTEAAMSVSALKSGCEAAIRMSQGKSVSAEEKESTVKVMAYIDGYVECLTVLQKMNPELKLLHIPESGRLRITYVQAVLATILADPVLEKEGTARVAVMVALKKNYAP